MAMEPILAMTAAEMRNISEIPPRIAWMACHFSPYGLGLSNLPKGLPPGSLLILDDCTPPGRHDPELVAEQLTQCAETLECCGILLDFQRPGNDETANLTACLIQTSFPCSVCISEIYSQNTTNPVFLPPCPHHRSLQEYIAPWHGREIWLDLAVDAETITLTESGATITPFPLGEIPESGFPEPKLHCHYSIETNSDSARFTLWRAREDLKALMQEAQSLGIQTFVSLFQEWQ